MAQPQREEEGWPLGLQPLNVRIGLPANRDFSGSVSFNTLITGSPTSSTDSSSDLDTQSTGSFFQDKSITLGSIIGISNIVELSRRSVRGRRAEAPKERKTHKSKTWLFSLCSRDSTDAANVNSLGHFLSAERRGGASAGDPTRNQSPITYGADEFGLFVPGAEPNSLFADGCIAPPQSSLMFSSDVDQRQDRVLGIFSCMCAQPSH